LALHAQPIGMKNGNVCKLLCSTVSDVEL
jgi:hypothetical protein